MNESDQTILLVEEDANEVFLPLVNLEPPSRG